MYYKTRDIILSALIGLLGLVLIFSSVIGLIKPVFIKQTYRKQVLRYFLFPGIIFFSIGVYFTPAPDKPKTRIALSTANNTKRIQQTQPEAIKSMPKRDKFDINKIFNREKSVVDEFLGEPINCQLESTSLFCQYEWMGTEIYFNKANNTARTIIILDLPLVKFSKKALKSIGLKTKAQPNLSNDFVINWNYVNGMEISVMPDKNNPAKVANIYIKAVPLTISHTKASGLPVSAVISFALKNLHKELNDKNHTSSVVFKLYMDELLDKYGNDIPAKFIHSFQLSKNDVIEMRKYNPKSFHVYDNDFHARFAKELSKNPWAVKFWFNAQ